MIFFRSLLTLAFIAASGMAAAQQPPSSVQPQEPPNGAMADGAIADGMADDSFVGGANAVTKVRIQGWALLCTADSINPAECLAYTQNGGQTAKGMIVARLMVPRVAYPEEPIIRLEITPPLAGDRSFSLGVDQNAPLVATVPSCEETTCRITITGDAAAGLIRQFKSGSKATFTFLIAEATPASIRLSLSGFTAAVQALETASVY